MSNGYINHHYLEKKRWAQVTQLTRPQGQVCSLIVHEWLLGFLLELEPRLKGEKDSLHISIHISLLYSGFIQLCQDKSKVLKQLQGGHEKSCFRGLFGGHHPDYSFRQPLWNRGHIIWLPEDKLTQSSRFFQTWLQTCSFENTQCYSWIN